MWQTRRICVVSPAPRESESEVVTQSHVSPMGCVITSQSPGLTFSYPKHLSFGSLPLLSIEDKEVR